MWSMSLTPLAVLLSLVVLATTSGARADYRRVAAADPDSVTAGVARDGLARLDGRQLLPLATVTCPPGAVEAFSAAERMFSTGRFDEAIYLHLLDESLVGEFRAFRDAHADRLVDYLLTVVAPAQQSAIAEPPG